MISELYQKLDFFDLKNRRDRREEIQLIPLYDFKKNRMAKGLALCCFTKKLRYVYF